MTRSQYMYGWSDYKKRWEHKLNFFYACLRYSILSFCVGVSALTLTLPLILNILSFVFLCVGVPAVTLTLVQIEPILGFLKEYTDHRVLSGLYENNGSTNCTCICASLPGPYLFFTNIWHSLRTWTDKGTRF